MLNTDEMVLKIFKCRKVKTPTKAWEAAGWDFYIPEDLSVLDFADSYKSYLDDSVVYDKNYCYYIPLIFHLKSTRTDRKESVQLVLKYVDNTWKFFIVKSSGNPFNLIYVLDELGNDLVNWVSDGETVVEKIEILPHSSINIPSGIHVNLPENVFLKAENKSGISSKRRLIFMASTIDQDFLGEIHINLMNTSNLSVNITAGEKIIQFIPMYQPVMKTTEEYSSLEELSKGKDSKRGQGCFGSSGEK